MRKGGQLMNIKTIKIISFVLTAVGAAINLATSALGDKILDNKIETKVSEALTKNN